MDKLISYIDQRFKRCGHMSGSQAIYSNYYTFGNTVVRVSDHIKYGEDGVKKFDYCFIIQPNDTYIFTASPKMENGCMGRMYLKIVSLQEAKDFIKKLHEFSISYEKMMEVYKPEGWNRNTPKIEKMSWKKFYETFIKELDDKRKQNILDIIECTIFGGISKGNLEVKMERVPKIYEQATLIQYDTILDKVKKRCGTN